MSYREELDTIHERELLGYLDSRPEPHRSQEHARRNTIYTREVTVPCVACGADLDIEITASGSGRDREVLVDYTIRCDTCGELSEAQEEAQRSAAIDAFERACEDYARYGRDDS